MVAEELSQDEIDSLLSGGDDDSEKEETGGIDPEVRGFFDLLNNSIEEVLKTAFSLEVVSKFTDLNIVSKDDVGLEDKVFITTKVKKDESELNFVFIIDKKFASILSDLMLMGPGEPKDELESDDLDALKELFSQVFGHFSTAVKENVAVLLEFEVADATLEATSFEDELYKAVYDIALPNIEDGIIEAYISKQIEEFLKTEEQGIELEEAEEVPFKEVEEEVQPVQPSTEEVTAVSAPKNLDLIMDIDLEVKIRIGEKYMLIKDILDLKDGSIIELDKNIEEPMDILVNGKVVAKGVVVVVGGRFGVKITHIETKEERIKSLGG